MHQRRYRGILVAGVAGSLLLGACGSEPESDSGAGATTPAPAPAVTSTAVPADLQPVRAVNLQVGVPADWVEERDAQEQGEDIAFALPAAEQPDDPNLAPDEEIEAGHGGEAGHDHAEGGYAAQRVAVIVSDPDPLELPAALDAHVARTLEGLPGGRLESRADQPVPGAQGAVRTAFASKSQDGVPQSIYDLYVRTGRYDILVRFTTREPPTDPELADRIFASALILP